MNNTFFPSKVNTLQISFIPATFFQSSRVYRLYRFIFVHHTFARMNAKFLVSYFLLPFLVLFSFGLWNRHREVQNGSVVTTQKSKVSFNIWKFQVGWVLTITYFNHFSFTKIFTWISTKIALFSDRVSCNKVTRWQNYHLVKKIFHPAKNFGTENLRKKLVFIFLNKQKLFFL